MDDRISNFIAIGAKRHEEAETRSRSALWWAIGTLAAVQIISIVVGVYYD